MSTDPFRDFVLEQLGRLDVWRHFEAHPYTLQDHPAFQAAVFAAPEKRVLHDFRGFSSDILKDIVQLTTWKRKTTRP